MYRCVVQEIVHRPRAETMPHRFVSARANMRKQMQHADHTTHTCFVFVTHFGVDFLRKIFIEFQAGLFQPLRLEQVATPAFGYRFL